MAVSALCFGMLALWSLVMMATAQLYISPPRLTGFGNDGLTMYVTPEGVIGNGGQIVGYQVVPVDDPYNQQAALNLEQAPIDNHGRLSDTFSQQSLSHADRTSMDGHPARQPKARQGQKRLSNYRQNDRIKATRTPVYVPVPIRQQKRKKKKSKTLSVSKGFFIAGGNEIFGKFKTLKSCQEACDKTASCLGGDYDKWTKRCYMHSDNTVCNSMQPHKQLTHFKKVPCSTTDMGIEFGLISHGQNLDHGLLLKGIKDIQTCIKKCLQAGGGVAADANVTTVLSTPQICFGIDYDFASHKCYFHTSVTIFNTPDDVEPLLLGITDGVVCHVNTTATSPIAPAGLIARPNVVNIVVCPPPI